MKIIDVAGADFLVKVELTWIQDPGSSPEDSWRLMTNTLNVSFRQK